MLCGIASYWISFRDFAYEYCLTAESETDSLSVYGMAFFFSELQDSFDISKCKNLQNFVWPPAVPCS